MERFVADRLLRFSDCDPSGIADFPAYLNLLNSVVEDFWVHLGFSLRELIRGRGIGTPTVQLDCRFQRPALFGERLAFALRVVKLGRSSMHLEHEVTGADGMKWSARQVLVATSLIEHLPTPWPDDVRDSLCKHFPALRAETA